MTNLRSLVGGGFAGRRVESQITQVQAGGALGQLRRFRLFKLPLAQVSGALVASVALTLYSTAARVGFLTKHPAL
jgi:hypothetical protein